MARIDLNSIRRVEKEKTSVHEKVDTVYSVFEVNGEKYVQIETLGKAGREIPGKVSQVIQFDKNTAILITDLLKREFNL